MSQKSNRPVDWEELVTHNETRLYRAALAILGDPQEAEDAVQDAFVRYLEKAPADLESSSAWLMLPTPGPEERQELEELFALPPEDRVAIHLHYYEGYSTDEIAQILGCRPGTVRSRLSRARDRLRKLLEL